MRTSPKVCPLNLKKKIRQNNALWLEWSWSRGWCLPRQFLLPFPESSSEPEGHWGQTALWLLFSYVIVPWIHSKTPHGSKAGNEFHENRSALSSSYKRTCTAPVCLQSIPETKETNLQSPVYILESQHIPPSYQTGLGLTWNLYMCWGRGLFWCLLRGLWFFWAHQYIMVYDISREKVYFVGKQKENNMSCNLSTHHFEMGIQCLILLLNEVQKHG